MSMSGPPITVLDVLRTLEKTAPLDLAESYDNVGLLLGSPSMPVQSVICALELNEKVVAEATDRNAELIVCHHPCIFKPLKKINPDESAGRLLQQLIKRDIACIAMHTNWDRVAGGTSYYMAQRLGLMHRRTLAPETGRLVRLSLTTPQETFLSIREALNTSVQPISLKYAGGWMSWPVHEGFTPLPGSQPRQGHIHQPEISETLLLTVIVKETDLATALSALRRIHPFEEFWYEVTALDNATETVGYGCVGEWPEPLEWAEAMAKIKDVFKCPKIRCAPPPKGPVQRVALCGGSGAGLYSHARKAGADLYLTADVKYHDFAEADPRTLLVDIGHYESEFLVAEQFAEILQEAWPDSLTVHRIHPGPPVLYF